MAEAVTAEAGQSAFEDRFAKFCYNLTARNYRFFSLDKTTPSFDQGRVYLRYDLLPEAADFAIARRIAALHERFRIPGSFHIPWDVIENSEPLKAAAASLRQLDSGWVTLGMQCDPVSGWLARSRFADDDRRLSEFVRSPELAKFFEDTLAARRREGNEGPTLRAIRQGAWDRLVELDRSFRASLGACTSISGRGSPLSNAFGKAAQQMPLLSTIAAWISSVDFLVSEQARLRELGYGCEATRFPADERSGASVFFCGDETLRLQKALGIRLAGCDGFLAIFPIKYWATDKYADLVPDLDLIDPRSGFKKQESPASDPGVSSQPQKSPLPEAHRPGREPRSRGAKRRRSGEARETRAVVSPPVPPVQALPVYPILTNPADLVVFGPRCEWLNTREVCAAARQKLGSGIDLSFPRFVEWLRAEGYSLGGFEDGLPRFAERWAYLRYDVHGQDLLAAYVLAELHEQLGIIGSFQINWRHTRAEEAIEPYFLKLLEFDRRYVQFGLHAAPTATWYLQEKLDGDLARQRDAVLADDFAEWLLELRAAYDRDGEEAVGLKEIREGTDDTFVRIAASFREAFGSWRSVSGHGNYLTAGFVRARQQHPELRPLDPYFLPVEYMRKFGVRRFGFDYEVTAFGRDLSVFPRLMTEGASEAVRRRWYRGRVREGLGFVALLHPASWTCRHNAAFFLPGAVPDAAQ